MQKCAIITCDTESDAMYDIMLYGNEASVVQCARVALCQKCARLAGLARRCEG